MAVEKVVYKSIPQDQNGDSSSPHTPKPPKGFGTRHTQALLLFISLSVGYSMRAHLSVSLVAMTGNSTFQMWYPNYTKHCISENFTISGAIKVGNENGLGEDNYTESEECRMMREDFNNWSVHKVYPWSKPVQEMILSSFFVGYTGMMLPMGLLAQKVGGKIPIMIALGANGVLSILTPWMPIFSGWIGVCACRLLQGMTQAAFYPSTHTILGRWAPVSERSRLASYIYTGSQFGTVVAFQLSGLFAGSPSMGWPASFWFCGVTSLACCAMLAKFGASTPHEHPSISNDELVYIVGENAGAAPKKRRTPWKHILTSLSVWGIISAHVGSAMVYLVILTQIPLYMNKILGVDIKRNGVYSSLPYISMYLTALVFGYIADWLSIKKIMTLVNIRRLGNSIGMMVSSFFLIAFCFVNNTSLAVILLVLCLATHSGVHVGFHVNSIDLAPNFAGPIMALGNMLANLASLLNPVLVSEIIGDDTTNHYKWQILFVIVSAIQIITNIVFVVFAKGTVQSWNSYDEDKLEGENADDSKLGTTFELTINR